MKKPTPSEALELLKSVAFDFKGTRKDHETIELSLQTILAALKELEELKKPNVEAE